jgi:predicted flap endonuclease-1-like 5' DNA nuclease
MSKFLRGDPEDEKQAGFLGWMVQGLVFGLALGWVVLKIRQRDTLEQTLEKGETSPREIKLPDLSDQEEGVEDQPVNLSETSSKVDLSKDELELIKGIGPVFARRLNAAGISTYQKFMQQPPEKLLEITQAKIRQTGDALEWIEQAKVLESKKRGN